MRHGRNYRLGCNNAPAAQKAPVLALNEAQKRLQSVDQGFRSKADGPCTHGAREKRSCSYQQSCSLSNRKLAVLKIDGIRGNCLNQRSRQQILLQDFHAQRNQKLRLRSLSQVQCKTQELEYCRVVRHFVVGNQCATLDFSYFKKMLIHPHV